MRFGVDICIPKWLRWVVSACVRDDLINRASVTGEAKRSYEKDFADGAIKITGEISKAADSRGKPWRSMVIAPRDGTVIEIECRYGVKPWRRLYKWSKDRVTLRGRISADYVGGPDWVGVPDEMSGLYRESSCVWRPWTAPIDAHRDPLKGFDDFDFYCGKRPPGYVPDCVSR